ncbi:MAG: hypothetical protein JXB26_12285 [Candidatus Aminicenantes bacterium]|nr:hypothetical protein [Candidatus Aminicenantes bacterium]
MTSKERFLAALNRDIPDRLPVTTHHLMPSYLRRQGKGKTPMEFFDYFGLDPIDWVFACRPDEEKGDSQVSQPAVLEGGRDFLLCSKFWVPNREILSGPGKSEVRLSFITPRKTLKMRKRGDEHTFWITENLIKEKSDIEVLAEFAPSSLCDVEEVRRSAKKLGQKGLVRGTVPGFDVLGQPGCWQDAAVLFGIENLILQAYEDPAWVHRFLTILKDRKKKYIHSAAGAPFDIMELGGGDASTTVISPSLFDTFVAPYDAELIHLAHEAGQKIVYHTCGGMMPLLERIADMGADAAETFTPPAMGGDADLKEAKKRIGRRLCMIGGFDQIHFFSGSTPAAVRREVRRCFEAAGRGGGYIISPSDHFFTAEDRLLLAYGDEAGKCNYE